MRYLCLLLICLSPWHAEAKTGAVRGVVSVQTSSKPAPPKRYYMGPYRSGLRTQAEETDGPRNTVVYLEGAPGIPDTTTVRPPPVIRQKDERYIPHVLPVQAGTSVSFPNEDDFYHNVFSVVAGDRFDLGRYAQGETAHQKFDKPGVVVVRCEIHPGMKAYILVLDTAFFTVPSETGTYALTGVAPGTYKLTAWHPELGMQSHIVTVPASGDVQADFSF